MYISEAQEALWKVGVEYICLGYFFLKIHILCMCLFGGSKYTQKMLLNLLKLELQVVVLGISIAADGNQI